MCKYRFGIDMNLEEIYDPQICSNALFRLDTPIMIRKEDILDLRDGQWFLLAQEHRIPIDGRWCPIAT